MVHVHQVRDQGNVVLEFSGVLDARSAEEVGLIAVQQPGSLNLVIDLSRATNIHDSALGRLLDALPPLRARTFRGAGRHHARLLTYLGEEMEACGDPAAHND